MPIVAPKNNIADTLNAYAETMRAMVISMLQAEAMEVVNQIKMPIEQGGFRRYHDQTGNLTSSIGYIIMLDGDIVDEYGFNAALSTGEQGVIEGRAYAQQVSIDYPKGFAVVVVAGMDYAAYVERRGLGGMTSGEQELRARVHKGMLNIIKTIKNLSV